MSGHSKWHSIKHKKARVDAAKGKIFTRLIKELTVAARIGGGDADMNPRLRTAIQAAKASNMPAKNIDNAIKKGTGELPGVIYEEVIYEGYGPGGVALYISAMTDNKNRTVAEIRYLLNKNGGNLGESGCVAWMFEKKGLISFDKDGVDEEKLLEVALEAGAEDVKEESDGFDVYTPPSDFETVKEAFDNAELKYSSSSVSMIPQNTIKLEGKKAEQMINLMEALEDNDDISNVYANFDIPDEVMEAIG